MCYRRWWYMNCGISCVRRYLEITHGDMGIISRLQERVSEKGLSLADVAEVMEANGYGISAYKGRVQGVLPLILLDDVRGHYYLLEKRKGIWLFLYDPNRGTIRIPFFLLGLCGYNYFVTVERLMV